MIQKLLLGICVLIMAACVDYKDVSLVSFENMNITKISPDGIEGDIALKIKNPNDYKIKVGTKDLIFSLNNNPVGEANLKETITLNKNSEEVYTAKLIVTIPEDGKIDLGRIVLFSGGNISMQLKGEITGKAKGISKTVPVDISQKISL